MEYGSGVMEKGDQSCSWVSNSVIDVVVALIMALVVIGSGYLSVTRNDISIPVDARVVVARQGQNLWSLAQANPVHGLDTAQTVALIRLLNTKDDSGLKQGEAIVVPISSTVQ